MADAISRYREASEQSDPAAIAALLTPDAELVSPVSGHMVFRGAEDLLVLLTAIYGSLTGLRWSEEIGEGRVRVLIGEAKVGPFRFGDAMVFELAADGRIRRIRPHLRPWLGLTAFTLIVSSKMARHPGVVWRALRRP